MPTIDAINAIERSAGTLNAIARDGPLSAACPLRFVLPNATPDVPSPVSCDDFTKGDIGAADSSPGSMGTVPAPVAASVPVATGMGAPYAPLSSVETSVTIAAVCSADAWDEFDVTACCS